MELSSSRTPSGGVWDGNVGRGEGREGQIRKEEGWEQERERERRRWRVIDMLEKGEGNEKGGGRRKVEKGKGARNGRGRAKEGKGEGEG